MDFEKNLLTIFYTGRIFKGQHLLIGEGLGELVICKRRNRGKNAWEQQLPHKHIPGFGKVSFIVELCEFLGYEVADKMPKMLVIPKCIVSADGSEVYPQMLIRLSKRKFKTYREWYKDYENVFFVDLSRKD